MRKGKYIIYGLIIWAISWAMCGAAIYFAIGCLPYLHLVKYLVYFVCWLLVIAITGIGGTYLGWSQMKAPADPKKIFITNSAEYPNKQYETIVKILQSNFENINDFRVQYIKENFAYPKGATPCELIYRYKENGKEELGRFEGDGETHFLHLEDKYLIPSNYKIVKKAKNVKARFWEGWRSSQSQRYDVQSFTLLQGPNNKDRIFYSEYINDISEIDSELENIPEDIKKAIRQSSFEEGIKILSDYYTK